jgi:ribosomal protein L11 methyltransferase
MEKSAFVEILLPIGAEYFDVAIGLLSQIGYESFWEDGDTLRAYLPSTAWSPAQESATQATLAQILPTPPTLHISFLPARNWNAEWEATLRPIEVSRRIVIVPSSYKAWAHAHDQIAIEINPKMAFGTGYHETTRLMIRMLEQVLSPHDRILDIGTGTGILAIAARKLGNLNPILALDNDVWSIENALENIALNPCHDIEVKLLDAQCDLCAVLSTAPWSLILANLHRNILETILPTLHEHAPEAQVLLSGILKYDEPWLRRLTSKLHYRIVSLTKENEWLCAFLKPLAMLNQTGEHG